MTTPDSLDPWDAINRLRADGWALSECALQFFPDRLDLANELDAIEDEVRADLRDDELPNGTRAQRAERRVTRKRQIIVELGGHTSNPNNRSTP